MTSEFLANLSDGIWQKIMLPLVFFGGAYFTVKSRGLQFFRFQEMLHTVFGSLFKKKSAPGSVTPFQALTTALAGTVGTGSIVGSCQAVAMGGYGAVFWMVVAAFLGMIIKFFEVTLAVHFRRKNTQGDFVGGPMYYILYGMKKGRRCLAALFAVFAVFASFGMGNLAQANSISSAVVGIVNSFSGLTPGAEFRLSLAVGIGLAILLGISILGGIRRIGKVSEGVVPGMCLLFLLLALGVLLKNAALLPAILSRIARDAFTAKAIGGAGAGIGAKLALEWGLKRSAFSNEAGLGSSAIAHAAADTEHPVKQGFFGIFEVFADTVVISVITCLAILVCVPDETVFSSTTPNASLITAAFSTIYGKRFAAIFIGISLALFAFSTLLGWSLTGKRCVEFLLGERAGKPYQFLFILLSALGAVFPAESIWTLSDLFNGLMAIPNFIALFSLKNTVLDLIKDYFSQKKNLPLPQEKV